jgi:DHA1 family bicyclomycin/chloramphenicol resistance-like MFS transporter
MVLALDDHGEEAGLASSLGGTMQMLTGGLMIGLASPFFDGTALPMIAAIAICGLLALSLVVIMLPRSRVPA